MKIAFNKVAKDNSYSLDLDDERFSIKASFKIKPKTASTVYCDLAFQGEINTICNRCGKDIIEKVDENVELLISNGLFDGFDDDLDVVEALDGFVDFDEVLLSELELISTNYFNCGSCDDIENIEY